MNGIPINPELGVPWWVSVPLADLTTPGEYQVRPQDNNKQWQQYGDHRNDYRVVLTWFQYDFVAANGDGFDLVYKDNISSPPLNRYIIQPRATTAVTRVEGGGTCFIAGPSGIFSPLENAADLWVMPTVTPPTSGRLILGGHVPSYDEALGHVAKYTGSPIDMGNL
jgi:hypothetical protein